VIFPFVFWGLLRCWLRRHQRRTRRLTGRRQSG